MCFHYKEYGDKNASLMLFLHGGGVSGWMWDKQIEFFPHYHCIVPDLFEHGLRDHNTNFSIKGNAESLIDLIHEKAKGRQVIVIGFSLGAQVAIQMASNEPDLIDVAIINSPLVLPISHVRKWIPPAAKLAFPLIKNRAFSRLQAKTMYIDQDNFEKYFQESRHMKPDTLIRVLEENMSFEIPKDFCKATGKLLVTVGEKEKAVMKASAKELVKANENCTGVLIPKIGHGIPIAKPDFFNQMVEAWISEGRLPKEGKVIGC